MSERYQLLTQGLRALGGQIIRLDLLLKVEVADEVFVDGVEGDAEIQGHTIYGEFSAVARCVQYVIGEMSFN